MEQRRLDPEHPLAGIVIAFVSSRRLYFGALALLAVVSIVIVIQRWLLAEGTAGLVAALLHTIVVAAGLPLLIRLSLRGRNDVLQWLDERSLTETEADTPGK